MAKQSGSPPPSSLPSKPATPSQPTQSSSSAPSKSPPQTAKSAPVSPSQPLPKPKPAPVTMTSQEIKKLPAGASSQAALERATGGQVEKLGRRSLDNCFALNLDGKRFIYVRPQTQGADRKTAYDHQNLKKAIDPKAAEKGKQFDHVASTNVEGGKMGMKYVLASLVGASANQSHGSTNEKGSAPTREAAKAFSGGIDRKGEHHVTYLTNEMAEKLAGQKSSGKGHSTLRRDLTVQERQAVSEALFQNAEHQTKIANMTKNSKSKEANATVLARQKTEGRSR